jgi:large subunit ribosomal protein L1
MFAHLTRCGGASAARAATAQGAAAGAAWSGSSTSNSSSSTVSSAPPLSSIPRRAFAVKNMQDADHCYGLAEGVRLARAMAANRFDEMVDVALNMNLDPRKPNQMLRGIAALPHGTGQKVVVAVFAKGAKALEATEAGADIVGGDELAKEILDGKMAFTKVIATPDMMGVVGKVARVLGPRGLMPNPKVGSVTMNVAEAIKAARHGQVEYKCERAGIIHAPVGRLSIGDDALVDNITALVESINDAKPPGAPKGTYIARCHVSTCQGPGFPVNVRLPPFRMKRM